MNYFKIICYVAAALCFIGAGVCQILICIKHYGH